ncbi:hypothetical protein, partial [Pseudomonas coronafaciens]|uniref:hypothetical protein n=1 Tax=Pseudomonas coronafaciens TaxID=53409 RepID=UPI001C8145FD
ETLIAYALRVFVFMAFAKLHPVDQASLPIPGSHPDQHAYSNPARLPLWFGLRFQSHPPRKQACP